jgi:hypothetical protein
MSLAQFVEGLDVPRTPTPLTKTIILLSILRIVYCSYEHKS